MVDHGAVEDDHVHATWYETVDDEDGGHALEVEGEQSEDCEGNKDDEETDDGEEFEDGAQTERCEPAWPADAFIESSLLP
jgi:hypothetical protein